MVKDIKEILKDYQTHFAKMSKDIPDTRNAIVELLHSVHQDGALSAKIKELICVAISLYAHCEGCMVYHTKRALEANATREEIMEACSCAILMGGGPATAYISTIMQSIEEFSK
ncbi:MAG: carboxymuconolactone decarboxylase family protein [Candidatus Hodarchaeota archaeon]